VLKRCFSTLNKLQTCNPTRLKNTFVFSIRRLAGLHYPRRYAVYKKTSIIIVIVISKSDASFRLMYVWSSTRRGHRRGTDTGNPYSRYYFLKVYVSLPSHAVARVRRNNEAACYRPRLRAHEQARRRVVARNAFTDKAGHDTNCRSPIKWLRTTWNLKPLVTRNRVVDNVNVEKTLLFNFERT